MNTVSINGMNISTNGKNITIRDGKVTIDGKDVTPVEKQISIVVTGDIDSIKADTCDTIDVKGSVMALNTMSGDVKVAGNVDGSVKTIDVIQTYFKDVKNITFDCSIAHRKYFVYGENLIGTTHGDGGKNADLPLTMAHEAKEAWGTTKHKYIYTHHVHHKVSKDYMGVAVESLRSASSADSWHHRNQYHFAPKAIEGFVHSKEHGQVARFTHLF